MKYSLLNAIVILAILSACTSTRKFNKQDDGNVTINFVQVNDVYEIAPLNGGKDGGMARVATVKKKYLSANPNTLLVVAGDFLSPSVFNSLRYEGKAIRGKQMVEAMNAAGMDLAIFGNHEFDIPESDLLSRINESKFDWISSNTFHSQGGNVQPFKKSLPGGGYYTFPETYIKTIHNADGRVAKIGFIALTLPFNKVPFVEYTDAFTTAGKLYNQLKDSVDAVIAITHQSMEEDEQLAKQIPGLALIIGGHEHDQRFEKVGNMYITKAMANAKSAYILTMTINLKDHTVSVIPKLELLDEHMPLDSATNVVVQKWVGIADANYASLGFNATKVVLSKGEPLDGREAEIRSHPTNLTKMIIASMQKTVPAAEICIMNSGSIRVDDILQMPVTQYDIIRALPYGGGIKEVDIKGRLLMQVLTAGLKNKNNGGYLQYNNDLHFDEQSGQWMLNNTALDTLKTYRVAFSEFLLTGGEANLGFLTLNNIDITKVYDVDPAKLAVMSDLRRAVIDHAATMK